MQSLDVTCFMFDRSNYGSQRPRILSYYYKKTHTLWNKSCFFRVQSIEVLELGFYIFDFDMSFMNATWISKFHRKIQTDLPKAHKRRIFFLIYHSY